MCVYRIFTDITKEEKVDAFGEDEMEMPDIHQELSTLGFETVNLLMSVWEEEEVDEADWAMLCIHQKTEISVLINAHFSGEVQEGTIDECRRETAERVRTAIADGVQNFHC
jgi:hypothetical protein